MSERTASTLRAIVSPTNECASRNLAQKGSETRPKFTIDIRRANLRHQPLQVLADSWQALRASPYRTICVHPQSRNSAALFLACERIPVERPTGMLDRRRPEPSLMERTWCSGR